VSDIVAAGSYIEIYNPDGTLKKFFQSGVGDFLGCSFTLTESGCQDAQLFFAGFVDIEKRDIVKIKLFNSDSYFFTGVIRDVPLDGSTIQEYNYTAFGLGDYFLRLNTGNQTYNATTIRAIVIDLLDDIITPNSPITKNISKIDALSIGVTSITFKYVTVKKALEELLKLANSDGLEYRVGVDAAGDFFFAARNTETVATLVVGARGDYGIEEYRPKESYEAVSKLYVLKKDGTYYGAYTSTEDLDVFEKKLTAPDIADADIDAWAQGQLAILEQETKEAQINWQVRTSDPFQIIADGRIRIISNLLPPSQQKVSALRYGEGAYGSGPYGGYAYIGTDVDDLLKIKQVTYTVNDQEAYMQLQLGQLPVQLDREVIAINQDLQNLRVSLGR